MLYSLHNSIEFDRPTWYLPAEETGMHANIIFLEPFIILKYLCIYTILYCNQMLAHLFGDYLYEVYLVACNQTMLSG